MNEEFARELCRLNDRFYANQSASFSATRASSWEGWGRVAEAMRSALAASAPRVLDIACGNLRFERFLAAEFPDAALRCVAVDNCETLLPVDLPEGVRFVHTDVMDELRRCRALAFKDDRFDLSVCFGFMHHVPLATWRLQLLDALLDATCPGGLVAVSLWRFMDNDSLAEKARRVTPEALACLGWQDRADELDPGDFLLGWQDAPGTYRYCHSFSDAEVDVLVRHATTGANPRATLEARFRADGRTHDLNEYLILRRR